LGAYFLDGAHQKEAQAIAACDVFRPRFFDFLSPCGCGQNRALQPINLAFHFGAGKQCERRCRDLTKK
jgi:hypothetical protein